jgi:hypothetical protein
MSKENMFESFTPIRDVDYYYATLKKFKENPDLMSGVKMINLHCRCCCPDLPKGLKGVACYNSRCHFGKFKSRLRSCNVSVKEIQEEEQSLFNKILYTIGAKKK